MSAGSAAASFHIDTNNTTQHHLASYTLNPYTFKQKADINVNKKVLPERFYKFVQSFQLIVFRKGVKIHSALLSSV